MDKKTFKFYLEGTLKAFLMLAFVLVLIRLTFLILQTI